MIQVLNSQLADFFERTKEGVEITIGIVKIYSRKSKGATFPKLNVAPVVGVISLRYHQTIKLPDSINL
jgi:hypothetical protein